MGLQLAQQLRTQAQAANALTAEEEAAIDAEHVKVQGNYDAAVKAAKERLGKTA